MYFDAEQTQQSIQASPIAQPREPVLARAAEGFVVGWLAARVIRKVARQQPAEPWDNS